jgi:ditrans,polycis-polyprenyl diphosphate synthase
MSMDYSLFRRAILNIMMAYSSREEITAAVQSTVRQSLDQNLHTECVVVPCDINPHPTIYLHSDITEDDIDANLYTTLAGNGPVDILVRTSGVKRFSDFLMWQVCPPSQPISIRSLCTFFAIPVL